MAKNNDVSFEEWLKVSLQLSVESSLLLDEIINCNELSTLAKRGLTKSKLKRIPLKERDKLLKISLDAQIKFSIPFNFIFNNSHFEALLNSYEYAQYNDTILIMGPTGTGKTFFSKFIHDNSNFREGPFIKMVASAIPKGLEESELFGHIKGAFSGANRDKKGLVELADGGSLFIDEIGAMDLKPQAKILDFIENKTFRPVGYDKKENKTSNCRIILATNENLDDENKFRADLKHRISGIKINLPSLNEVLRNDIFNIFITSFFISRALNHPRYENNKFIEFFLDILKKSAPDAASLLIKLKEENKETCVKEIKRILFTNKKFLSSRLESIVNNYKKFKQITNDFKLIKEYKWKGNIRSFDSYLRKALILNDWSLPNDKKERERIIRNDIFKEKPSSFVENEKSYIKKIYDYCNCNLAECARISGLSRDTFTNKAEKYKIHFPQKKMPKNKAHA